MFVLTINTGSSSVRLAVHEKAAGGTLRAGPAMRCESGGIDARAQLSAFLGDIGVSPSLVAHRVVHGGVHLTTARRIDDAVEAEIERLSPLAPLHHPPALAWIRAAREVLGAALPQVAVFDTAFFAALPPEATAYALPRTLCERHGVRRFGFHGLAHQALCKRWREVHPKLSKGGKVVSFQLGSGCSAAAIDHGRPLDTSMGFTPLEGLVMASRSGDIDPGLLLYLQRVENISPAALERLLNEESGLRGVSGLSGDMRVLLASTEPSARLAVDLYVHRARKYLGAYLAVLGGADGVLIGGGVGEHASAVRAAILRGFEWAGLELDVAANAGAIGREARISGPASRIAAWVIPVDEGRVLAEEALAIFND